MKRIVFGTAKACPKCDTVKPLALFYRDKSRQDGNTVYCRACWPRTPKRLNAVNLRYNTTARTKVQALLHRLKSRPCADCGNTYPYYVMDFDHVRGEKLFVLGHANGNHYGLVRVDAEAAKCDVVCSNCHRTRTFKRRQCLKT